MIPGRLIRRNGTRVWGAGAGQFHPGLDVQLPFAKAVYALPEAFSALTNDFPSR